MKPILEIHPFSDEKITVAAYGKPDNWSLRAFRNGTPDEQKEIGMKLSETAENAGVKKILLTFTWEFTGRMAERNELDQIYNLSNGVTLQTGASAEGVEIKPGEAFAVNLADCGVIVLHDTKSGRVWGAHAGRDSLWDRAHVLEGKPKRKFESIVHSLLAPFPFNEREHLEVFIGFGIHAENFSHPWNDASHGKDNEKMCCHFTDTLGWNFGESDEEKQKGKLDISRIAACQFFDMEEVYNVKIFSDIDPYTDARFWSNRRGEKERNLILVSVK